MWTAMLFNSFTQNLLDLQHHFHQFYEIMYGLQGNLQFPHAISYIDLHHIMDHWSNQRMWENKRQKKNWYNRYGFMSVLSSKGVLCLSFWNCWNLLKIQVCVLCLLLITVSSIFEQLLYVKLLVKMSTELNIYSLTSNEQLKAMQIKDKDLGKNNAIGCTGNQQFPSGWDI